MAEIILARYLCPKVVFTIYSGFMFLVYTDEWVYCLEC